MEITKSPSICNAASMTGLPLLAAASGAESFLLEVDP